MAEYTLNIAFSNDDLAKLEGSGRKVVIVKQTSDNSNGLHDTNGNDLGVAWLAIDPEQNIEVTWENKYMIYASSSKFESGASIKTSATEEEPMPKDFVYIYQNSGVFKSKDFDSGVKNTYYVRNEWKDTRTFGLAQEALVAGNGQGFTPINAEPLFTDENASFLPKEAVCIFLAKEDSSGKVISYVKSDVLSVDLTSESSRSVVYDSAISRFVNA